MCSLLKESNSLLILYQVQTIMFDTVREQCAFAFAEFTALPREVWVLNWPSQVLCSKKSPRFNFQLVLQVVLTVSQIFWAVDVSQVLAIAIFLQFRSNVLSRASYLVLMLLLKSLRTTRASWRLLLGLCASHRAVSIEGITD